MAPTTSKLARALTHTRSLFYIHGSIRSIQGMQFFPKIFFLLFTLFHVYFFSCPFGFSYLALASTSIFMIHSMYFFWHRYELPAVAHGLVSIDNPRMGISVAPSEMDRIMVPLLPPNTSEEEQQQQQHRLHLPPRNPILRGQSHLSMTSLGRNSTASRAHSSTGLPFHGDDDGDGSESYMYFMNGEVCCSLCVKEASLCWNRCSVASMVLWLYSQTNGHPTYYPLAGGNASRTKRSR